MMEISRHCPNEHYLNDSTKIANRELDDDT
jgi:hypothetical protein